MSRLHDADCVTGVGGRIDKVWMLTKEGELHMEAAKAQFTYLASL